MAQDTRFFKPDFYFGNQYKYGSLIELTNCSETDIYDQNGNYTFTIVSGTDQNGVKTSAPTTIEVTNPKVQ
jgi:hypothetical protein